MLKAAFFTFRSPSNLAKLCDSLIPLLMAVALPPDVSGIKLGEGEVKSGSLCTQYKQTPVLVNAVPVLGMKQIRV